MQAHLRQPAVLENAFRQNRHVAARMLQLGLAGPVGQHVMGRTVLQSALEDEIRQTVENRPATVDLHPGKGMYTMADEHVRPGVDRLAGDPAQEVRRMVFDRLLQALVPVEAALGIEMARLVGVDRGDQEIRVDLAIGDGRKDAFPVALVHVVMERARILPSLVPLVVEAQARRCLRTPGRQAPGRSP